VNWYDEAEAYDILFGWDPAQERAFIFGATERWGIPRPRRILEPFCGSGRMLRAMDGRAIGCDRNPHMLRLAAARAPVFRADAARFAVRRGSFDLAYCLIDSFRHLLTEEEAFGHLRCVGRALRPGAVYILGFDVTGDIPGGAYMQEWTERRDGVEVAGRIRTLGDADPATRIETLHARVETGGRVIESFQPLRTYTRRQAEDLIDGEGSFEIAAVFDLRYDLGRPVELGEINGSAVLVLRAG